MNDEIQAIRRMLTRAEILAQLAEEAAELSQAALKCRRAISGKNPTPKTYAETILDLREELSDVLLCTEILCLTADQSVMKAKCKRWMNRLLGVE